MKNFELVIDCHNYVEWSPLIANLIVLFSTGVFAQLYSVCRALDKDFPVSEKVFIMTFMASEEHASMNVTH